ncbi:MAG: hypothetical protein ACK562_03015 [Acidobacteriota bacterium]
MTPARTLDPAGAPCPVSGEVWREVSGVVWREVWREGRSAGFGLSRFREADGAVEGGHLPRWPLAGNLFADAAGHGE